MSFSDQSEDDPAMQCCDHNSNQKQLVVQLQYLPQNSTITFN